ncbi:MAG: hypothetical protein E7523_12305 [Ruminococcaceae bacterium]|nr:hypothetical protein [Oscillospiraceae bacterium]
MKIRTRKTLTAVACVIVFLSLCVAYLGLGWQTVSENRCLAGLFNTELYFTAHRGLSAVAPENTVPAIEAAGKAGYYAAEFDIMPTKDGQWILNHDDTVDKMTDGEGEVSSFTYDELRTLTVDNGNGIENYPDLRLPTFENALELCNEYGMRAMVEVKGGTPEDMQSMLGVLQSFPAYETAIVIDFDKDRIVKVRELDKDIELWYLLNHITENDIAFAAENNMGLAFNFGNADNYKMLKSAREQGITLAAWTVDFPPAVDFLHLFGVKYITTNKILP